MSRQTLCGWAPAFAGAFDFGFMALGAPAIDSELDLGVAYPWLFSAASLAYGAVVMPGAALAERVSRQRVLAGGLALAAAGAAVLAAASSVAAALLGRALFGLGGGVAASPALALLAAIEDPSLRRAGFARLGAAITLGFTTGVVLAALAVPAIGWRAPVAVAALALAAAARLAAGLSPQGASPRAATATGAWLFGIATLAAAGCLAAVSERPALACGALAVGLALAIVASRRARATLPRKRVATLTVCLAGAATTASGVGATVLLGRSLEGRSGLVLGAFGLAVLPAVRVAEALGRCGGAAWSAAAGLAIQGAALVAVGWALAGARGAVVLAATIALFGAGHVVANAGTAAAVTDRAGDRAASAGGLLVTAQYLGGGAGPLLALAVADRHGDTAGALAAAAAAGGGAAVLATAGVLSAERRASVSAAPRIRRSSRSQGRARGSTALRESDGGGG